MADFDEDQDPAAEPGDQEPGDPSAEALPHAIVVRIAERTMGPNRAKIAKRLQVFADEWLKTRNATKAAVAAGYPDNEHARKQGSHWLRDPRVQKYIQAKEGVNDIRVRQSLKKYSFAAVEELRRMAFDDKVQDTIRYACLKDLLDRAGFKPIEKIATGDLHTLEQELASFREGATAPGGAGKEGNEGDEVVDIDVLPAKGGGGLP